MFGALYAADGASPDALVAVAREFSPRIDVCGARPFGTARAEIVLDLSGLSRLFGDPRTIAEELRRTAADRGLLLRVAIAGTRTAARLLVRHRAGLTCVAPGTEPIALAPLPLALLPHVSGDPDGTTDPDRSIALLHTFRRWGLNTCGDLAALPPDAVAARVGQEGVRWQALARGEDPRPLVPAVPVERFEQALDLEWPIDGLEPLSFVLGRLMEPLAAHLDRRGRAAAVLHVRLHLVTRALHERSLQLPAPIRDARTLRTLALLDLESHPPAAAIDRVEVAVDPAPARVLQFSLLTRPLPSPQQLSTLLARLTALMGEGRCGSPVPVDSWQPGVGAAKPFAPVESTPGSGTAWRPDVPSTPPVVALRRFRVPVPARVSVERGAPVRVTTDRRGVSGGRVETCAGPWRTSGGWWIDPCGSAPPSAVTNPAGEGRQPVEAPRAWSRPGAVMQAWDRDEWDATVSDGATYRVFHERNTGRWFVDGILD